jgi:hypothetical protein
MKFILLATVCNVSLSLFGQAVIGRPWTFGYGASTSSLFKKSPSLNLRYISPRFKWSHYELTEEDEKHPEKFKKARLMFEVIYSPPLNVLCTGINAQYRFVNYKKLSVEFYGGLKIFFMPGAEFETIRPLRERHGEIWYMTMGLLMQLNLGRIAPFIDIGGDGIITIGSELNFHSVFRKSKKRYKLHLETEHQ